MTEQELAKRRAEIVMLRNDRRSFEYIAERLGVSRQRVWQIYQKHLKVESNKPTWKKSKAVASAGLSS